MSSATNVNLNIYDLTTEQEAVLTSQETDAVTFLTKVIVLSQINSTIAGVNAITFLLTIIFIIAVAKALKEVIPVLPS